MYPKEEKNDVVVEAYSVDEQGNRKSTGFDALGTTVMTSTDDQRGIWEIDVRAQQQNLLHEMNDPSQFYNDQFPQIPDFPCMSSSSSSSSNPAPTKPISSSTRSSASTSSSSTSSAASWAVLKSEYVTENEEADREEDQSLMINRRNEPIGRKKFRLCRRRRLLKPVISCHIARFHLSLLPRHMLSLSLSLSLSCHISKTM